MSASGGILISKLLPDMPTCPACDSTHVVKNGRTHNGKQNHKCRGCGGQFVEHPTNKVITEHTKAIIDALLLEKISLAGIARATSVSQPWLQQYVNQRYEGAPRVVEVGTKKRAADDRV